jgi:signal transduction histidine kinase
MLIARQFAYPLVRLIEASNAVANGNLEVQIGSLSRDEVGDLTQRFNYMVRALKKSHSEAEHSHQQLLQAERLAVVGQLVASIVHEMRNPLSAIKMNLQILERKSDLSPSFTEHILIAREQVNRLERMLYELLEYSKPVIPTFYPMELRPLVEKFKYEKREQMQLKKISYRVELPSVPVVIKSDADILTRILDNLISNSINAYDEGGEIIVRVLDGEAIKIEMEDFGRGMSTKTLSRLFEPFFTTREDGVGLGMCNVKKFCEALNIKLEVQSELGKGTKVIVTVPKGLSNG